MLDVVIIGGGPAGLSAALLLGRACRSVLVLDAQRPRNSVSTAMHGFLSRDGFPPLAFLEVCRSDLQTYPNVQWRHADVSACESHPSGFTTTIPGEPPIHSRLILLATGVKDQLPEVPGLKEFFGTSVHHCPYCDGWEHRDTDLVAYGRGTEGADFAIELTAWSKSVALCTDGADLEPGTLECLTRRGIRAFREKIARVDGQEGRIESVRFESGDKLSCAALFFQSRARQGSELWSNLGCTCDNDDELIVNHCGETCVRGVFVAGNARQGYDMVVIAAAEGAKAAFAMNERLLGL